MSNFKVGDTVVCISKEGFVSVETKKPIKNAPKYKKSYIIESIEIINNKVYLSFGEEFCYSLFNIKGFSELTDVDYEEVDDFTEYQRTVSIPELLGFEESKIYPIRREDLQ